MRVMQNLPTQPQHEEFFKLIQQSYISNEAFQQFIKMCEQNQSLLHCPNRAGMRPIDEAAYNGCIQIVAYLLNQGVNPNEPNVFCSGQCPVHFAAMGGEIQTLLYLIAQGANPEVRDDKGNDLIYFAKESYEQSVVDFCKNKKEINKASAQYLLSEISKAWSYPYDELWYWRVMPHSKAIYRELCHSTTFMSRDVALKEFKNAISLDEKGKPTTIISRLFNQQPEFVKRINRRIGDLNSPKPLSNNGKQLPYELWLMIIRLFDTPTLINLALVSHFFAYMISELSQNSLQKKWQSQELYPLSFGSLRYIDSLFSDKYLKASVRLEHNMWGGYTDYYPDGIMPFISNRNDPNIWYVLADNVDAFKQHCVLAPIGQQQTYLPLALAKARKRIVEYLLSLRPKFASFGGSTLFSVNRADHATDQCLFYQVTLMRFFECAIISREVAMLDAVLAIKGAKFNYVHNDHLTYTIASGSVPMVDRLFRIRKLEISKEDISAAINSRQCDMFDKIIILYPEPLNQEDISLWTAEARLSCGEGSVMHKHVVEKFEQLQKPANVAKMSNKR